MGNDIHVREADVLRLTNTTIAVVNALKSGVDVAVGSATAAAAGALQSRQAAEAARDEAVAAEGTFTAPAKNVLDSIMGGNVTGLAAEVARQKAVTALNVKDFGALGDGVTDDTAAFNAAIQAGRAVKAPLGTYMINGVGTWNLRGIVMDKPGVTLDLSEATLKVIPNDQPRYSIITVTAPDNVIKGGHLLGDVGFHTGTSGEWGNGITFYAGSDGSQAVGVKASLCWGDGFIINSGNRVQLINCHAEYNRRQGLSISDGDSIVVDGGFYGYTGRTQEDNTTPGPGFTFPGHGIDVEPNASESVTNILIKNVLLEQSMYQGLTVSTIAANASVTGQVINCVARDNRSVGFNVKGKGLDTDAVELSNCYSSGAALGFFVDSSPGATIKGGTATGNRTGGFRVKSSLHVILSSCISKDNNTNNEASGAEIAGIGEVGGLMIQNCTVGTETSGHAGRGITIPTQTGNLPVTILATTVRGTYASGQTPAPANTIMFPYPKNNVRVLAAPATDSASTMALANDLRSALLSLRLGK